MNELEIRIPYADTDQMGMVYYANYYIYFERGRTEWLRHKGLRYKDLEDKGILLPVAESSCRYITPGRYDDVLTIRTKMSKLGFASIEFDYRILRGKDLVVEGKTKHPFVNKDFKPTRIPREVKQILEKHNG